MCHAKRFHCEAKATMSKLLTVRPAHLPWQWEMNSRTLTTAQRVAVENIVDDLTAATQKHTLTHSYINGNASLLRRCGLPVLKYTHTVTLT